MCLPVTNQLTDIYNGADQKAIVGLLGKMGKFFPVLASKNMKKQPALNVLLVVLNTSQAVQYYEIM